MTTHTITKEQHQVLGRPLTSLGISAETATALATHHDVLTIHDLLQLDYDTAVCTPGVNEQEIYQKMDAFLARMNWKPGDRFID